MEVNKYIATIAIAGSAAVIVKVIYDQAIEYFGPLSKIPGPKAYPIVKNPSLIHLMITGKRQEYFLKMAGIYGDIFKLCPTVYIVDAEQAKRILKSSGFVKSDLFVKTIAVGLLDNALFQLEGPVWKQHRKLIQPAFAPLHLRHAGQVAHQTMKDFDLVLAGKSEIEFTTAFKSITLDIISVVAFGHNFGATSKLKDNIEWHWKELEEFTFGPIKWRVIFPRFMWGLIGVSTSSTFVQKNRKKLFDFFDNLASQSNGKENVLARLLQEENGFTKEEMYGELIGFYFAGHETTAATLTWSLYMVCQHKQIAERLYDEVKEFELENSSKVELLNDLKYLDKFTKEVLRMYPIFDGLDRKCLDDIELLGYSIPRNTMITILICAIHMSEKYYTDPQVFNPDRWDDPHVPGSYLPFGDGPHNCIGQKMALIEVKVIIIHLLQKYRFELADDFVARPVTRTGYTLENLPVRVSRRTL
ncbi:hypothetical protein HDV01_003065 [Terramyces sp. JEL0728]|nr:hypothetical protein HDV01_003065 [Terramyces sp. JEL0728]